MIYVVGHLGAPSDLEFVLSVDLLVWFHPVTLCVFWLPIFLLEFSSVSVCSMGPGVTTDGEWSSPGTTSWTIREFPLGLKM